MVAGATFGSKIIELEDVVLQGAVTIAFDDVVAVSVANALEEMSRVMDFSSSSPLKSWLVLAQELW